MPDADIKRPNVMQYGTMAKFFRTILQQRNHFCSQVAVLESILNKNTVIKQARILDAACGTGDVASKLFRKGYQNIYAIDGSKKMLEQREKHAQSYIHAEHCLWENVGGFFKRHGQFDIIYILGHSLPHATVEDMPIILENIFRGLSNQGIFIFDMRLWEKDQSDRLIQPNRPEGFYRYLGTVSVNNCSYLIEDSVSYSHSSQIVDYKARKIQGNAVVGDSEISWQLRYSIFHHSEMQTWLSTAGFNKDNIEIQQYAEWPYLVFVCNK